MTLRTVYLLASLLVAPACSSAPAAGPESDAAPGGGSDDASGDAMTRTSDGPDAGGGDAGLDAGAAADPADTGPDVAAPWNPCPPEHAPGPDDACTPFGLTGCAPLFIDPATGLCLPSPELCGPGTIPRPEVGCVEVGLTGCDARFVDPVDGLCKPAPAHCPPGTIPRFDSGCVPVGPAPCAPEFVDPGDGLCRPSQDACGEGHLAIPAEGCVSLDGPDGCGDAPWGHVLDTPGTLYVDAAASHAPGPGTRQAPLGSIAAALALLPDGGRVVLAAGEYDEPVVLTAPVELVGRCPSLVRIQGVKATPWGVSAAVWIDGTDAATVRGVEVHAPAIGVMVTQATASLERVRIRGAGPIALLAAGPATVLDAAHLLVEDATGQGVAVQQGASVALDRTVVIRAVEMGILVGLDDPSLVVTGSLIEATQPLPGSLTFGRGLVIQDGAHAIIEDTVLRDHHDVGIVVSGAATVAEITRVVVADTQPRASDLTGGRGLSVHTGAHLTLSSSALVGNHDRGVFVAAGAELLASGDLIAGTGVRASDGGGGSGLLVQAATASLEHSSLVGNHRHGIMVSSPGAALVASGVLVAATEAPPEGDDQAWGLFVDKGTSATLTGSAIVDNRDVGVLVGLEGATLEAAGNVIARNGLLAPGPSSAVDIEWGASAHLVGNAIVDNRGTGLRAYDPEGTAGGAATTVETEGNLIAGTIPGAHEAGRGRGVQVELGARVTLVGDVLRGNHEVGLLAVGATAEATAIGCVIADTRPVPGEPYTAAGAWVTLGARLTLQQSAVLGNQDMGIFVSGLGSALDVTESVVARTVAASLEAMRGSGVVVHEGEVLLHGCAIVDNQAAGLMAVEALTGLRPDTPIHVADSLIARSAPARGAEGAGIGLYAWGRHVHLAVSGSVVRGSSAAGVAAIYATVDLTGSLIAGTRMGAMTGVERLGDGIVAVYADLTADGLRVEGNDRVGVLVHESWGLISGSQITGNQMGVVLQDVIGSVLGEDNTVEGNDANIVTDGQLAVPAEPLPVPPPPPPPRTEGAGE